MSHEDYFHVKSKIPKYINLFSRDELLELTEHTKPFSLLEESVRALEGRPKNTFLYIRQLQDLVVRLCQKILIDKAIIEGYRSELDRMDAKFGERSRKRWTKEEDEWLIEMASHDDTSVIDLSRMFGRTPGAIQTRISYLVGIEQLSSKVAGRFIGTIDGEQVEAEINGVVSKR